MSRRKAKQTDDDTDGTETGSNGTEAGKKGTEAGTKGKRTEGRPGGAAVVAQVRTRVAQLVWLFFLVCALFLAVGALLVALDANKQNALVGFVLDGARAVDLGIFSLQNGIKEFTGENAEVKNALLNWGLGAVAYLVVGRIVAGLIRP